MLFLDTETIGFEGPIVLIQYASGPAAPVQIHRVWDSSVEQTVKLIEFIVEYPDGVCAFNLPYDWWHLSKLYNVLKQLPNQQEPPKPDEVNQFWNQIPQWCIKPTQALDLLLCARKNDFQITMDRKSISIYKVPTAVADQLVNLLNKRTKLPSIVFNLKQIVNSLYWQQCDEDNDLCNIQLDFNPSTKLKDIIANIKNQIVIRHEDLHAPFDKHKSWVEQVWLFNEFWKVNSKAIQYAREDVEHLQFLYNLWEPKPNSIDDQLAVCVACCKHIGYALNLELITQLLRKEEDEFIKLTEHFNPNSSRSCLTYLHDVIDDATKTLIKNTNYRTLVELSTWDGLVAERAIQIQKARISAKKQNLYRKLLQKQRFYPEFKVIGARSGRMSGGAIDKHKGSINPQGIQRDKVIRGCFVLRSEQLPYLAGGDFWAFEPTITDAQINSTWLREGLLSGKKIYDLVGDVIAPTASYDKRKNAFLGYQYGAQSKKLAETYQVSEEETIKGLKELQKLCPELEQWRREIGKRFCSMRQPGGLGTPVIWQTPDNKMETMLGFQRDFSLENTICKMLYDLAADLPITTEGTIQRNPNKPPQTYRGACASALYAAAFALQADNMRAAVNHRIQGTGAYICKDLQATIWQLQPIGIHPYTVAPFNVHDEVMVPCKDEITMLATQTIADEIVTKYKSQIPLIKIEWKIKLESWGDK